MSHHTLSYDEVTKLTDNDIDEVRFLDISAWSSLSADEQAECYAHLRNLKRQVKNRPLDADDLTRLLRKITSTSSYVSPTSSAATSPAEDASYFDDYIQAEQRAYDDLVLDGGPVSHYPSRTFESALDKVHDPSGLGDEHDDVREIILYWLSRTGGSRYVLSEQLHTWKTFRKFQEQIRHDNSKFLDYCQRFRERRRKYNLEAVAELLPDQSQQTKLGNWEEYQNFHIIRAEELEERKQKLEEQVQEITSHYPQVAHAIQQSESENTHTLSLEQIDRQKAALDAKIQTMHLLRLCSKRYELIQSWSETETTATRANWISAARSELSTAQAVYDECVSSSKLEAERFRKRLGQFPSVWRETEVQRRKASREASNRIAVLHQEIKLAEDLLHKAQSDPVEDTFEIAYLKHILLQDLTHAEAISKLAEKELHEADLRGRLISLLGDIRSIHNDIDHHSKLLKWIGKQCSDIASQAKGYGVQMSLNRRSSLRSQKQRLGHLESRKPSNRIRKRSELGHQKFQESCTMLPTALRRSKRIRRKPERYCPC